MGFGDQPNSGVARLAGVGCTPSQGLAVVAARRVDNDKMVVWRLRMVEDGGEKMEVGLISPMAPGGLSGKMDMHVMTAPDSTNRMHVPT